MSKSPEVITYGCRLNAWESEVIKTHAEGAGLANAVVFNTCAVTAEATRQARQGIRKAKRLNPDAKIIVTGCAAQIDPAMFDKMTEVDHVIGNQEKLESDSWKQLSLGTEALPKVQVNDIFSVKETAGHLIDGFGDRARAFVQIQNGCDHRCTFCVIPYGRGNSRSVPMGEAVDQMKRLVDSGYNEIVLTGVDITSFGADLPGKPTLGVLVQKILTLIPDLPRLRISSIDSIEVDEPLMEAITSERRLMPHLHLSLQAGDNMILKRMKRRHLREDAIDFCNAVSKARPDMVYGADIIAGFPTETEAMFENSLDLVKSCNLRWLHVFPYSEREGTPAARIPNKVPKSVRKERAARLRALGENQVQDLLSASDGKTASVLVERQLENGFGLGHSEQFIPVVVEKPCSPGDIMEVTLAPRDANSMTGR